MRAIAVLPVVLFHAGLGLRGGYVGVDVFFVISGFLITGLILQAERFSLLAFWERRVRRILPASSVMVLGSLIAGWFLLMPKAYEQLARSAVAHATLWSNVFFYRDDGYWKTDQIRPLLHTWSLAVEEQFYLLFPLFVLLVRRFARRALPAMLGLATLLSFAFSLYCVKRDQAFAFFYLPPRAWELSLGAVLASVPALSLRSRWQNELTSVLGLGAILICCWRYSEQTRFPGAAALAPCLGAAAIIFSNTPERTWVGRLLARRPFVFVGSISYSLYLWHWPLLAFARCRVPELPARLAVLVVAASLLVAYASWKLVETPLRARRVLARGGPLLLAASAVLALVLVSGLGVQRAAGVPGRWGPEVQGYLRGQSDRDFHDELSPEAAARGELKVLGAPSASGRPALLVWGDSHGMAVLHVVDLLCRERQLRCLAATHSATAPLLDFPGYSFYSLRDEATRYNRAIADIVVREHVARVLLVGFWADYGDAGKDGFGRALDETARYLRGAGARVYILEDVPTPRFDVPNVLAMAVAAGRDPRRIGVELAAYRARNEYVNRFFRALEPSVAAVLDPTSAFCDSFGLCHVEDGGRALYYDGHHLTTLGSLRLRALLEPVLASDSP